MKRQYGTITSLIKDAEDGSQLAHVKSNINYREYQNCEIITPKGVNYLPKIGDLVLFGEIHNSEIVVLGVLEPYDFLLEEGEIMIHRGENSMVGQNELYSLVTRLKLNKDNELEISRGETDLSGAVQQFNPTARMKINKDNEIIIQRGTGENGDMIPQQEIIMDDAGDTIIQTLDSVGTVLSRIVMKANGDIEIEPQAQITINCVNANIVASNTITLDAPLVQVI